MSEHIEEHHKRAKKISLIMALVVGCAVAYIMAYVLGTDEFGEQYGILGFTSRISHGQIFFRPSVASLGGLAIGVGIGCAIYFLNYMDSSKRAHYKDEEVAGTGRFMTDKEIDEYVKKNVPPDPPVLDKNLPVPYDPDKDKQMYPQSFIMSWRMRRPADPRKMIGNNSVMIVGGPGSGKTRFFIKPNILQMNSSYVITDPSGETIHSVGTVLQNHGYKIKIFNLSDMRHSNHYNPLKYISDSAGVQSLITCFINNTQKGESAGDNQFFVDAEKLLYSACIYYLRDINPDKSLCNFSEIVRMVNMSDVNEANAKEESRLDKMFAEDRVEPSSLAGTMYRAFKQGAGKTLRSIIISCLVRLQPFMVPEVQELTNMDDIDLDRIAYEKTALFIITPQGDDTYSFLASMLYSQLFDTLYRIGDKNERETGNASLPIHVRCMMDEFVNIGEIPDFARKLSTMRKYNISASIVLQGISQIEAKYKDEWRTMIDDCSTTVFLGGNEQNTVKYFSELLGKMTVRAKSDNISASSKHGGSEGYQNTGREVMTADELRRMPSDECIVYTQSEYAAKDKKYKYEKHPYYPQTADCDPANAFDYTKDPTFDIARNSNMSLMRSREDAAKYRRMQAEERSRFKPAKEQEYRISGIPADLVWEGVENEETAFKNIVASAVLKAMSEDDGPVCIITTWGVPAKRLEALLDRVSLRSKRPALIIINNIGLRESPNALVAAGIDRNNTGIEMIMDTQNTKAAGSYEREEGAVVSISTITQGTAEDAKKLMLKKAGFIAPDK